MATGGLNLSRDFFELLKAIGESKSKQEEDRIIAREVQKLKQKMETPAQANAGGLTGGGSRKLAKEFLVRLLYVSMLGHDNSWGLIRAVELAASASLYHKRTGYLVCGACLPPDHEFRFMLVNQMQRDLQSANVLEVCGGILACSSIITADMVPAVAGDVTKLLAHDSATVRKKVIVCLHKFYQLAPEVVTAQELQGHLEKVLCDKDPAVMGSSLNVLHAMAVQNASALKHTVPSLVAILKQIGDRRLPAEYDYHRMPAPWMQLQLVRILGVLGQADATTSQGMYEILADCMKKADTGINAGYAIVYECVKCIVSIYPNQHLLDAAGAAISRFMQSQSHNLKYLGVTGLALMVEQHPQYAAQHQMAVLDCLEDPDETLQRKTLDLLYNMTNPQNVEFITEKLVHFLSHSSNDVFLQKVLTERICNIAERYAPNQAWYLQSITQLLQVAGEWVPPTVAQNLMQLLAEGTGNEHDEEADMLLRQTAVELYVDLLLQQSSSSSTSNSANSNGQGLPPQILLETMAWVLGEYGYLSAIQSVEQVLEHLCQLCHDSATASILPPSTRLMMIQAICKLIAQAGTCPPCAAAVLENYSTSSQVELQQRCLVFQWLLTSCPQVLPEVFPVDASTEDLNVDVNLSFLDDYVSDCMVNHGAKPYEKPELDDEDDDDEDGMYGGTSGSAGAKSSFKMTPYEKPPTPGQSLMGLSGMGANRPAVPSVSLPPGAAGGGGSTLSATGGNSTAASKPGEPSLNTRNVANVWGRGGLTTSTTAPAAAAPAAGPPSSSSWGESSGGAFATNSHARASSYGGAAAPAAPAVKTAEQLEKERQAAALFGGIVPGGAAPPAPSAVPPRPTAAAAVAPSPAAPPPVAAAPVSAPAPEVDLLDMGLWDDTPAPAPAPATSVFDTAPPPMDTGTTTTSASAAALVETVTDDDDDVGGGGGETAPAPAAVASDNLDPFASMMDGVQDTPLETLPPMTSSQKFEYNGTPMGPLPIDTAQFGQQWGTCSATAPVSVTSTKTATLDQFMELAASTGAHKVEAIAASNEGICAGMVGGSQMVLIHAKLSPLGNGSTKIDATIKSTDQAMAGSLAMYMQTLMR